MANEAVIIELPDENAKSFTCANAIGIEKGALLWLEEPATVSGAVTAGAPFGGICASEKVASDGSTKVAVWKSGVFDLVAEGAVVIGAKVKISGTNMIATATEANIASGYAMGVVEETTSVAEVVRVRVGSF